MATTSDLDRVAAVVLQFMRGPILVLLSVYALGISGMALMPGVDDAGNPARMSLFHAFYFFTYTATTTGFGEIPTAFTDEQRLWATICLYTGVIAWLYAVGSIIHLALHPELLRALAERRFARSTAAFTEPFFLICGFGDTGSLLARGLSDNAMAAAVLDSDPERIKALRLRNYRVKMPGLCADASVPRHLLDAGVQHHLCQAVVILTDNDEVNLKIAVMTRFLNPRIRIICRSTNEAQQEMLKTVGSVTPVNPFEIFARQLGTAIQAPLLRTWEDWLLGAADADLQQPLRAPNGKWVLCGFGRMGRTIHKNLSARGASTVIFDSSEQSDFPETRIIRGRVDRHTLDQAGLGEAVGLVAGTDNDEENLRILLSARAFNPECFLVVRQNRHENELAFNAADANLIMQPSLVMARHILLVLITPMIGDLLQWLRNESSVVIEILVERTRHLMADAKAQLWTETLPVSATLPGVPAAGTGSIKVQNMLRHPSARELRLAAMVLVVLRGENSHMLPDGDFSLKSGDRLLLVGSRKARALIYSTLRNPYTLYYLRTGMEAPRSWVFQWIGQRTSKEG